MESPKPVPLDFAVSGERLEKPVQHLRRDAFAGVLKFGDHFMRRSR